MPVPPAGFDRTQIDRMFRALGAADGATRIVGGWVRDSLLGLDPADLDVATQLTPDAVTARARDAGFTVWSSASGLAHGTVGVVVERGGRTIEVTTLRRDVATDGRRATVTFTAEWQEDAARRDFTINALSADPLTGALFDYFGGLDDLAAGTVRFIGDPLVRIAEDHLRILRFFRFHARFGTAAPDAEGLAACIARANDLMALSRERIADELAKLLAVADPVPTVRIMREAGIFAPVLPEIDADGVQRLERLVAREKASAIAPDAERRLAALLPSDPAVAGAAAARLKLSNAARLRIERLADRTAWITDGSPFQRAYGLPADVAVDRLLLGDEPIETVRAHATALAVTPLPTFPIKGGDLIAMGLRPGPAVAATLQAIERDWVAADFPDPDWVRAEAARRVAGNG